MLYEIAKKALEKEEKGEKVIKMNVGELPFDVSEDVKKEIIEAIKKERVRYSHPAGIIELREKLGEIHKAKKENIVIHNGSKFSVYSILSLFLKKEALLISPHWTAYRKIIKSLGKKYEEIETKIENKWEINEEEFKEKIKGKDLVIINNPSNPLSITLKNERELIEIAKEENVLVVLDDAYRDLSFNHLKERELEENVLVLKTFSKSYAMSGYRVGYVFGEKNKIEKIIKFNQITITSVPSFIQKGALKAIEVVDKKEIVKKCKEWMDYSYDFLRKEGIEVVKGDAGFYLFPKIGVDSIKLSLNLIEKGVAVAPGIAFGNYNEYIRISICLDREELEEGLEKIVKEREKLKN